MKTALAEAESTVYRVGFVCLTHADTEAFGGRLGYGDLLSFYFAGRGGVLGDVDAGVVAAAMGFWEPGMVRAKWNAGIDVAAPRRAAHDYGRAIAAWGEHHLSDITGTERLIELAGRVVAAADPSCVPLFAGWCAQLPAAAGPARLMQLLFLLRELRGGLHLAATTAAGLSPLQATLATGRPDLAHQLGWQGTLPDCTELAALREQAEDTTDRLTASVYDRALSPDERAEFIDLVAGVGARVFSATH